jgi:hypothetical protein
MNSQIDPRTKNDRLGPRSTINSHLDPPTKKVIIQLMSRTSIGPNPTTLPIYANVVVQTWMRPGETCRKNTSLLYLHHVHSLCLSMIILLPRGCTCMFCLHRPLALQLQLRMRSEGTCSMAMEQTKRGVQERGGCKGREIVFFLQL